MFSQFSDVLTIEIVVVAKARLKEFGVERSWKAIIQDVQKKMKQAGLKPELLLDPLKELSLYVRAPRRRRAAPRAWPRARARAHARGGDMERGSEARSVAARQRDTARSWRCADPAGNDDLRWLCNCCIIAV